jgi:hypothetical protein
MARNKAILLVVLAVDLRAPIIRSDDLVKPVLQCFLGSERQVELN